MGQLDGKVALITGGAAGIGRAIVELFAAEGARVAALDIDTATLEATAHELAAADTEVLALPGDVADRATVQDAVRRCVDRFDRLDVLVNNAGVTVRGDLADLPEDEWERVFAVNVKGAFLCMQTAVAAMAASGGGSIINLTSISARSCYPGNGAYSASKAALENLGRQAAVEFAPHGIRVNSISPGWVRTALTEYVYQQPGELARRNATIPLGRIATVDDVARLAVFLASDASAYISGESIEIDGALLAGALKAVFELTRIRPTPAE
jgi:NAD(P)-dependent dehydrogenase (short-subunit alcohol dehydrogenase family)